MSRSRQTHPQAWRQLQLREWLVAGRQFNASEAASEFQVSRRTIMQDLENMRAFGHEIEYNHQSRSFELSEASRELPVNRIRKSELAAISVAKEVLTTFGAAPLPVAVDRVLQRVHQLLPDLLDVDVGPFSPSQSILRGLPAETPLPWMKKFDACIDRKQTVRIHYVSIDEQSDPEPNGNVARHVDPYRVIARDGRGYVIAYCHTEKEVRVFRMDRIYSFEALDQYFNVQDGFDIEAFLGSMVDVFKDQESYDVRVRFSPSVAKWIKEDQWHESQVMSDLPGGWLQVDLHVTGLLDVRRWILSFGGDAEVIEPDFLRRTVSRELEKMQAVYGSLSWSGDGSLQRMRSTTLDDHEQ